LKLAIDGERRLAFAPTIALSMGVEINAISNAARAVLASFALIRAAGADFVTLQQLEMTRLREAMT
jgi:pyruvate formate-lyase activating enzyme-like uncharacterized protein